MALEYGLFLSTNTRIKSVVLYISTPLEVLVHNIVSLYERRTDIEPGGCCNLGCDKGRVMQPSNCCVGRTYDQNLRVT